MQRLQGEGGVAHPRVAVVPVALAAGRLGQRGGERGHRGAGRHVGQALDRQRRALDRVRGSGGRACAPAPARSARSAWWRRSSPRRRRRPAGRRAPRPTRARSTPALPARGRDGPARGRPRSRARGPSAEADRLARAARVGRVAAAVDERPFGRRAPVVERRLADQVDLDPALEALDRPHQHVVGVVVGRRPRVRRDRVLVLPRPHRQRVADDDPARGRLPRRHEHVRPGLVDARRRVVDAERARSGRSPPGGRAGWRRRSARRSGARTASRSTRPARRARPCGSRRGTRSRRSAGTARAPWRSGDPARRALTTPPTARASRRGPPRARPRPPGPTSPARRRARGAARRAAAA